MILPASQTESVRVVQDADGVLLVVGGRFVGRLSAGKAAEVGNAILSVARLASEWAEAERVAADQALLLRKGVPLGIAQHAAVQREAEKLALYDRDLRRYIPSTMSIRSAESVGRPSIIRGEPRS